MDCHSWPCVASALGLAGLLGCLERQERRERLWISATALLLGLYQRLGARAVRSLAQDGLDAGAEAQQGLPRPELQAF